MGGKNSLKKGGIDTIVAFVVVLIPITYIIVFMVATIYHFTVQMYLNQVVKETLIMASSYGELTDSMVNDYLTPKVRKVIDDGFEIEYYVRKLNDDGEVEALSGPISDRSSLKKTYNLSKGDLLGLYIESNQKSLLGTVSSISLFNSEGETSLKYVSYREEIIRNESP